MTRKTSRSKPYLEVLSASAKTNRSLYAFSKPSKTVLETFPQPAGPKEHNMVVEIRTSEFTSLCPLTHQPDFATIIIRYRPDQLCVESKSMKLYLMRFRNHGAFHEECCQRILNDLVAVLKPLWIEVKGEFTPRGGIPFWPICTYEQPGWDEKTQRFVGGIIGKPKVFGFDFDPREISIPIDTGRLQGSLGGRITHRENPAPTVRVRINAKRSSDFLRSAVRAKKNVVRALKINKREFLKP